jgi:hypothetical protein
MRERAEDLGTDDEQVADLQCAAGLLLLEYMADGERWECGTVGQAVVLLPALSPCRDWAMNKANTPSALAKSLGARKFCFELSAARTAHCWFH